MNTFELLFCPAYWDWIDHQFSKGDLNSVIPVFAELSSYGDDLAVWIKARKHQFIDMSPEPVQDKFAEIAAARMRLMRSAYAPNLMSADAGWSCCENVMQENWILQRLI